MSVHVATWLADLVENRLDEGLTRQSRAHLETCVECAADFEWARAFRERALAQGVRHLTPERVLALAAGDAPPVASEEHAHLEQCAACRSELEWARALDPFEAVIEAIEPKPEPEPAPVPEAVIAAEASGPPGVASPAFAPAPAPVVPPAAVARRVPAPGLLWAGAALALAVVAFVMVLALPGRRATRAERAAARTEAATPASATEPPVPPPAPTLATLARIAPLPPRFTRQGEEPGSFDEARALGLDAYGVGAYEIAAEHLRRALAMRPRDEEIRLYLGSTELLRHNPNAALPLFEMVTVTSDDSAMVHEALWQLANAWLLLDDREEALATIRRLNQRGGRHGASAEALRGEIERFAATR